MKKILSLLVVLSLTLVCFSSIVFAAEKTTITFASYLGQGEQRAALEAAIAQFEKQYPDIDVVVNTTAHEQFKNIFPGLLTTSKAPDIATWSAGYRMTYLAEKSLFEPLPEDIFPGGEFGKEYPEAFKAACSYEGDIMVVPTQVNPWVIFYNKAVFAENNLEVPETWEEFNEVCETLKVNDVSPIAIGARDTWVLGGWIDMLGAHVNGIDYYRDFLDGEIPYTDPGIKKTFEYILDLDEKGYFMANSTSYGWQEATTPLFNGQAGMYLMGTFLSGVWPEDKREDMGFFRFPSIGSSEYYVDAPLDGYVIPKNAKNKEEAMTLIKWLASAEGQKAFFDPLTLLSAHKEVVPKTDFQKDVQKVLNGASGATMFFDRDAPEEMAAKAFNATFDMMNTPENIDEILKGLDEERIRIYDLD